MEERLPLERAQKAGQEAEILKKRATERSTEQAAKDRDIHLDRKRDEAAATEGKRAAECAAKKRADKLAFEKAKAAARDAKTHAEALALEKTRHAESAAREVEHMKEIERAEAGTRDAAVRAEALLMEKEMTSDRALNEMERRLAAERDAAASRGAKAHAEVLAADKKLAEGRDSRKQEMRRALERAEAAARDARLRAESLIKEKKAVVESASKERQQRLSLEKAESTAIEAKRQAEDMLTRTKRAFEQEPQTSTSGWIIQADIGVNATTPASAKRSHEHSHEAYDATGHLMEHIVEDTKQTKEVIEDGFENPKKSVLDTNSGTHYAENEGRETLVQVENAATPERRSWWPSRSNMTDKASNVGLNVKATASKTEAEVATEGKNSIREVSETAKNTNDNAIDVAATIDDQAQHLHRHHGHAGKDTDEHHLYNHIRADLRQTKESIEHGVKHLQEESMDAERVAEGAKSEATKCWNTATQQADAEMKQTKASVDKAATEGKDWWSARMREAERKASLLDADVRAELNKAGGKLRELDETMDTSGHDDDYWFRAEQTHQQQQQQQSRRGSGHAM
ncbi:hypothetical protein EDD11_006540 [Mortierella claussenii]|nr:hypothetical protein EDD11_006540 [Mortierella claussenii]